jgi:tetratricopeptide (TPR) repeat protein
VQALDHLAVVNVIRSGVGAALPLFNEGFEIASAAPLQGRDRGVRASIKTNFAGTLLLSGDLVRAETLLHEALTEFQQASPQAPWEEGLAFGHLGVLRLRKNQPAEAEKYLFQCERILRHTLGDKNLYLAGCLNWQATGLLLKGDLAAAETKALEALHMMRDVLPDNKLLWAGPMQTLGAIQVKTGRVREGEDNYRQALAIYEQQPTKNFFYIVPIEIRLSQFLLGQSRLAEAEQVAQSADQDAQQHLVESPALREMAAKNLGQILETKGKSK